MNAERAERLAALRAQLGAHEAKSGLARPMLPFGIDPIDRHLGGGLRRDALHELVASRATEGELAILFAASLLARLQGTALWCLSGRDLFAPGLARIGLHPDRVLYAEVFRERDVLAAMEEGLRHGSLCAVVGEVGRLGLTGSRRLQLAAENSGCLALVIRRLGRDATPEPNAAFTRWRVLPVPSPAPSVPGLMRAHWSLALERARGAEARTFLVEAPDAQGRLSLPADLGDRPLAAPARWAAAG